MRSLRFALLALPLLLLPTRAFASDDWDPEYDGDKFEAAVRLDGYRSSTNLGSASGVSGLALGAHLRLARRFALDLDLQQATGEDGTGYHRYDLAWNLPKLSFYLNPKAHTQLFVATGMEMRVSHFEDATLQVPDGTPWGHFYMGTFLGGGVEHRVDKTWALRLEADWFARGRVDGQQQQGATPLDPVFSQKTKGYRGIAISLGVLFF